MSESTCFPACSAMIACSEWRYVGEVMETIASSEKCNTGGILLDDDTKEVRVVSFNYARTERTWFDKGLEADFKKLEAAAPEGSEI